MQEAFQENHAGGPPGKALDAVGKAHVSGEAGWDSTLKSKALSLKFKIISDIGSKSEIEKLNGGKGVPITFHLHPIDDIAKRFSVSLQHACPES